MDVSSAEIATYVLQAALMVLDLIVTAVWEVIPLSIGLLILTMQGAVLFFTIFSNNKNRDVIEGLQREGKKMADQIAFPDEAPQKAEAATLNASCPDFDLLSVDCESDLLGAGEVSHDRLRNIQLVAPCLVKVHNDCELPRILFPFRHRLTHSYLYIYAIRYTPAIHMDTQGYYIHMDMSHAMTSVWQDEKTRRLQSWLAETKSKR